jgi:hypothetical protein
MNWHIEYFDEYKRRDGVSREEVSREAILAVARDMGLRYRIYRIVGPGTVMETPEINAWCKANPRGRY